MTTSTMTLTESLRTDFLSRITHAVISTPLNEGRAVLGERPPFLGSSWEETSPRSTVILPVRKEESSYQITEVSLSVESEGFTPRTPLGEKLLSLRNRAIASGMRLLSNDEVLEKIKRRRGELGNDEAHVY